jgi:putative DNA primase/helicase
MDYIAELTTLNVKFNPAYPINDIGVSTLFYEFHRDILRFVTESRAWYAYDGRRWEKDANGHKAMELCKAFAAGYHAYFKIVCPEEGGDDGDKALLKFAAGLSNRKKRESILKDAQSIEPLNLAAFDRNGLLFNCVNGTFDLRTMMLRPHSVADFVTKMSRVKYDAKADCPRWKQFIGEVTCNDIETARFLQKALGYALSGDTSLECFFIFYGATTRNGKTTLMETVAHILGDYSRTVQPQTLSRRSSDGAAASPDIARLKGARLVNMPEPEKGLELNDALLKQLTGGDTYTGRFLHENSFEFTPEFKIFIGTNHLPRAFDDTLFTSGRVKLVPFDRHFEPSEQDTGLKKLFRKYENMSGVLNWLIEGYRLLKEEGLTVPERVAAAIASYQFGNIDTIGAFIADMLIPSAGEKVKTSAIYALYRDWARDCGFRAVRVQDFVSELRNRVEVKHISAVGNVAVGFAIKSEADAIHVSDVCQVC